MPAVHGVHSLTLCGGLCDARGVEPDTQRLCSVVASLTALHSLKAPGQVTPAYFLAVAPALASLPLLARLDLHFRSVTQSEAAAVTLVLASLPALTRLSLTCIGQNSDACAQNFAPGLRCLSHLEYLDLSGWGQTGAAGTEPVSYTHLTLPTTPYV